MKIIHAIPMGAPMTENQVQDFLANSRMNAQIATVDRKGDPSIQPVWYYYDQSGNKLYVNTDKNSQKVQNIRRKDVVYFSVDEDTFPYRCVKGKAKVEVSEDVGKIVPVVEKMMIKYLGSSDHPWARRVLDIVKSGHSVLLELTPMYYSAWDFGGE